MLDVFSGYGIFTSDWLALTHTHSPWQKYFSSYKKNLFKVACEDQKYRGSLLILARAKVLCSKVEENGWAQLSNSSSCLMMLIAHCNRHESTLLWKSHWLNWWLTIVRFLKEQVHTTVKISPLNLINMKFPFEKGRSSCEEERKDAKVCDKIWKWLCDSRKIIPKWKREIF